MSATPQDPAPRILPTEEALFERLAAIEHERWADWQGYVRSLGVADNNGHLRLPASCVERWNRQIATPYAALSEAEREKDREQVRRYWPLVAAALATEREASRALLARIAELEAEARDAQPLICDELGCEREATCGWPSPAGCRQTCGQCAQRFDTFSPEPTPPAPQPAEEAPAPGRWRCEGCGWLGTASDIGGVKVGLYRHWISENWCGPCVPVPEPESEARS